MKILIYTRPPDHDSSITAEHWNAALRRNGLEALGHELVVCHSEGDLATHLHSATVVVSSKADLKLFISRTHATIRLVFFAFAGVDHLSPFDWLPENAWLVNNSGATAQAMGEYVIFALQALANGVVAPDVSTFASVAKQSGFASLGGRAVTIVGTGGVGGGVAAMCKAFRMRVIGVRRSGGPHPDFDTIYPSSELRTAVGQSDFVVLACPVTSETRGLVDASVIAAMKHGGYLVNVSRGAIVNEDALCDAVASGTLGGAVLDVVSAGSAGADARVRNTPGVLVTPHVSGDDRLHFIDNSLDVFMANLNQLLRGEGPSNAINVELGY